MILSFKTQINGQPTYFVERIQAGLVANQLWPQEYQQFIKDDLSVGAFALKHMKIHTIRIDLLNRWKVSTMIDFFINARTKSMFRFAPKIPVKSIQEIEVYYYNDENPTFTGEVSGIAKTRYNEVDVIIDGCSLTIDQIKELSQNDGFDSVFDFFYYFSLNFKGKIIHWTDKRY